MTLLNDEVVTALLVEDAGVTLLSRRRARYSACELLQAGQDFSATQVLATPIGTRFQKERSSDRAQKLVWHWLHMTQTESPYRIPHRASVLRIFGLRVVLDTLKRRLFEVSE